MVEQSILNEIRKERDRGNLIIGTNRTIKLLKLGKIEKVYVASNAPEEIVKDLEYYSKLANIELVKLDINNSDLGALVGKPFNVAVIGVLKEE